MTSRLQRRATTLWFWSILALSVLIATLLFYGLIWKAGILVDTRNKTVGFFSFCTWNPKVENITCQKNLTGLQELGVWYPKGVVFASVFAYFSLPIYLFVPLTLVFAWFGRSQPTWKLALGLVLISHLSLSIGTGMFLMFTWAMIEISELGCAFQTLIVADTLLLIQLVSALHFLPRFKEDSPGDKV